MEIPRSDQILILCSECAPYAVSGGLGYTTGEMTSVFKRIYGDKKDLRVFIPLYNATRSGPRINNERPVLEVFGTLDAQTGQAIRYELEDLHISTEVIYGARKSRASLYKIKYPVNNVPVYVIYISSFSHIKREYQDDFYEKYAFYMAFCCAAIELLKGLIKEKREAFYPSIIHTKDWHTSYAVFKLKTSDNYKELSRELKHIHEFSCAFITNQGKVEPFPAALNLFSHLQLDKLKSAPEFRRELVNLIILNRNFFLDQQTGLIPQGTDITQYVNNSSNLDAVLEFIGENFNKVMSNKDNLFIQINLNNIVRNTFTDIPWDENEDFNPSVIATNSCDAWYTMSRTHFEELVTDPSFSSLTLWNSMRANIHKGLGILARIDMARHDPGNKDQVEYPFSLANYGERKAKNKRFLLKQFELSNIQRKVFNPKLINRKDPVIFGHLSNESEDVPLIIGINRFDITQKGSDILLKAVEMVLEKHNVQFILAQPDICNFGQNILSDFTSRVIDNNKHEGKVVLIDCFVPVNQYFAGADLSVIPSRSETCGLVLFQSMRMGAVPVGPPVGSINDILLTINQNINKAMGFKLPLHLKMISNPVEILADTLSQAITFYNHEKSVFNEMIKNSLKFNSDWSESVNIYNELYECVTNGRIINTQDSLSDITGVTPNPLVMLHRNDIGMLESTDVLVVMAHPDDEIFFTVISHFLQKGMKVQVVYTADGSKGHRRYGAPATGNDLSRHRQKEVLDALYELSVNTNPLILSYPDNKICNEEIAKQVSEALDIILTKTKPTIVFSFGPDGFTGNIDHIATGKIVFDAVQKYNATLISQRHKAKLYQTALSKKSLYNFKMSMKGCGTDTWEYIGKPAKHSDICLMIDMSGYKDRIVKSLSCHRSQWDESEIEGFRLFFNDYMAEFTSLSEFFLPEDITSPWERKSMEFECMYGSEFHLISNNIVAFEPKSTRGESQNYSINICLANYGKDITHLWLASHLFDHVDIIPSAPAAVFKNIEKIIKIPIFSEIKAVLMALQSKTRPEIDVLKVPFHESKLFAGYATDFCKDLHVTWNRYKANHPTSKVSLEIISEFTFLSDGGVSFRPKRKNGGLEDFWINLYLANFGKDKQNLWVESELFKRPNLNPSTVITVFNNIDKIKKVEIFKNINFIDMIVSIKDKAFRYRIVIPVEESAIFVGYAIEFCKDVESAYVRYKRDNPSSGLYFNVIAAIY